MHTENEDECFYRLKNGWRVEPADFKSGKTMGRGASIQMSDAQVKTKVDYENSKCTILKVAGSVDVFSCGKHGAEVREQVPAETDPLLLNRSEA